MILGENGEKMSKSRGNVVNPDDIVREYGADTMRLYEMFIGDFEKAAPWSSSSIKGCKRFLDRIWGLRDILTEGKAYSPELESAMHRTIQKVSEDIEQLKFNTAIAAMMTLLNEVSDTGRINRAEMADFLKMLSPFAPHIAEELWQQCAFKGMLSRQSWPSYDADKCQSDTVEIAVQVNGKLRGRVVVSAGCPRDEAVAAARALPEIALLVEGKQTVKEICVPDKLVNIVVK